MVGADAFFGLSVAGAVTKEWLNQWQKSNYICNGKLYPRN